MVIKIDIDINRSTSNSSYLCEITLARWTPCISLHILPVSNLIAVRHVEGSTEFVAWGASEWFAEPEDFTRKRWTTLARHSILGSASFSSELHFVRASVRRFWVAEKCWSVAFRYKDCLKSAFSAIMFPCSWVWDFSPLGKVSSAVREVLIKSEDRNFFIHYFWYILVEDVGVPSSRSFLREYRKPSKSRSSWVPRLPSMNLLRENRTQ